MKFMIKMIDLIDAIPDMAVMNDISAFDTFVSGDEYIWAAVYVKC